MSGPSTERVNSDAIFGHENPYRRNGMIDTLSAAINVARGVPRAVGPHGSTWADGLIALLLRGGAQAPVPQN